MDKGCTSCSDTQCKARGAWEIDSFNRGTLLRNNKSVKCLCFVMQARHYYQIIKRPMDLSVIRAKLNKGNSTHYSSADHFVSDVYLMFSNCAKFNYVSKNKNKNMHACFCVTILYILQNNQRWLSLCVSLTAAWLWGGPSRPQPRGLLHLKAGRSFPRQSFPHGWGGLGQWRERRGLLGCWDRVPLAGEEGTVPQEEEEEAVAQVEEASLLTRGDENSAWRKDGFWVELIICKKIYKDEVSMVCRNVTVLPPDGSWTYCHFNELYSCRPLIKGAETALTSSGCF